MIDDPNRVTDFSTTLKAWEGIELKLGDLQVRITVVPLTGHGRGRNRVYIDAPRSVSINKFESETPDGGHDAA